LNSVAIAMPQPKSFQSNQPLPSFVAQASRVRYRHLKLEDLDKPVAGLDYEGHTYSFFKVLANWLEVEKVTNRMSDRFVITATKKGWAIWVFEY
jgi:hypothetical protein